MDSETIANALGNQWNYTTGEVKNRFVKLTETTLGEIIVRVSAITFINIETREICVCNTDVEGNEMLCITDDSMRKLLSIIVY
jgi:hypothetical protein